MNSSEGVTPALGPEDDNDETLPHPESFDEFLKNPNGPFDKPELVFALVRTLGSESDSLISALESELSTVGYTASLIKLSSYLKYQVSASNERDRYELLMDAGDAKRELYGLAGLLVIQSFAKMRKIRNEKAGPRAFIIDKLVRPEEVDTLRQVCGKRLFVIGCDAPRKTRIESLKIRFQRAGMDDDEAETAAVHVVNRDSGITSITFSKRFGVSVAKTLERSDVFVRSDNVEQTYRVIKRLVECIMSEPNHTVTLNEFGMATAFQAALTSASLARQVGAALMVGEQIVAIGTNEVPKAGGGVYHDESENDAREKVKGSDPSDPMRAQILSDLLRRLHLADQLAIRSDEPLSDETILNTLNLDWLRESRVFDIIEYTRTAHAEMVAITGAARLGIKVAGGTLYTTTLPCHECTRNIIAAGIARVVYLEPYPKSKGWELQSDSVALVAHGGEENHKVSFEPFSGISYRRFSDLFSWLPRKEDDVRKKSQRKLTFDGKVVSWKASGAEVRPSIFQPKYGFLNISSQQIKEAILLKQLDLKRQQLGLPEEPE